MNDFIETTGIGIMVLFAFVGVVVMPIWIMVAICGFTLVDIIVSVLCLVGAGWIVGRIVQRVSDD